MMIRTAPIWAAAAMLAAGTAAAQTLELATDQSPVGLDPHVATAFSTLLIAHNIYEGLTDIDKDLRVVPGLAESWTVSEDGKTIVFTLREGATFHNGEAFDAEDVAFSIARVQDPATGSPIASRFALIEKVEATSPTELTLTLSAPSAPLLGQLAQLYIVPKDYVEGGGDLQRSAVGTGPFSFAEWVPDTYIQLDKFPGYWEAGTPKLDGVRFNVVPEAATRQIGIAQGTYQMLPNMDPSIALALQGDPSVRVLEARDLGYSLVGMNVSQPPFDNPKAREALNTALDRQVIVEAAYFGLGEPGGPLSPALGDWALPVGDFPCYAADPEKAKALLTEAGLTLPVPLTIKVIGSVQVAVDVSQVVQAQLTEAGFAPTLDIQEQGQFIQDWKNSSFQAFVSLNGGAVDPDGYLYRTFLSTGSTNVFKFSDPELDAMLEEGRTTLDQARRKAIYDELQRRLACEGPIAHLVYGTLMTAVGPGVEGYEIVPDRSTRYLRTTTLGQ